MRAVFYGVQATAHTKHILLYQMIRANHLELANFPMDFQFPFWHSQIYARNEFPKRENQYCEKKHATNYAM